MVLARVFTTVEQVGDLTVQEVRQRKQPRFDEHYLRHGANSWLCRIFTKFNLFGLKGYTKVCAHCMELSAAPVLNVLELVL
jgi:hypothetical protein